MNWIIILTVLRLVGYGCLGYYAIRQRRWLVWTTITLLMLTNVAYFFVWVPDLLMEVLRTAVAVLICLTIWRRG